MELVGAQDLTTTEDGSYFINEALTNDERRKVDDCMVLPALLAVEGA